MSADLVESILALAGFVAGLGVATFRAGMKYSAINARMDVLSSRFTAIESMFTLSIRPDVVAEILKRQ